MRDQNGKIWGPWQAKDLDEQGGVPNAYWVAELTPSVDLLAGTYTIIDSNLATWSFTGETENIGIASVIALKGWRHQGGERSLCREGTFDFSPASPTDQYRAGPSLAPGSYKIW